MSFHILYSGREIRFVDECSFLLKKGSIVLPNSTYVLEVQLPLGCLFWAALWFNLTKVFFLVSGAAWAKTLISLTEEHSTGGFISLMHCPGLENPFDFLASISCSYSCSCFYAVLKVLGTITSDWIQIRHTRGRADCIPNPR